MFYFRKEEVRNFFSFLNQLRKDRPWVFYTLAIGLAAGLGLAVAALIFPAGTAVPLAIASYFNVPILANSPVLLAAIAVDSMLWTTALFAIFLNWIIKGDTWRSLNQFFTDLSKHQPILNYGLILTLCSSLACTLASIVFPPASIAGMVVGYVLPPLVDVFGLMATLLVKSTVNAIEDGIFRGSSAANAQRPVVVADAPVSSAAPQYVYMPVSAPYSVPAGMYAAMPAPQPYPASTAASSSSQVDGSPAYQPAP